jgi:hypothetical protein
VYLSLLRCGRQHDNKNKRNEVIANEEESLTIRQNTKMRKQIGRIQPAATDDIREIISRSDNNPDLQVLGNMVRIIANTHKQSMQVARRSLERFLEEL